MIYYRPCGLINKAPTPRDAWDEELYAYLSERLGMKISIDPEQDYEDWIEPAAMLAATLRLGYEVAVLPKTNLKDAIATPEVIVDGKPGPDMLIGRWARNDEHALMDMNFAWPVDDHSRANHYAELETFHLLAGRKLRLAHFPGEKGHDIPFIGNAEKGTDIDTAMADFDTVMIKQVWPPKAFPVTQAETNGRTGQKVLMDTMGLHICRFEGDQNAILLQEKIRMRYETRLFVVGGKIVCGAGVIENHTPQQNMCMVVNPFFEETRNDGTRLINHDLANDFFEEGQAIADAIKAESGLETYVLDVALNDDNEIIIIELNPIAQAGLYGVNADLLMDGILTYIQGETQGDSHD